MWYPPSNTGGEGPNSSPGQCDPVPEPAGGADEPDRDGRLFQVALSWTASLGAVNSKVARRDSVGPYGTIASRSGCDPIYGHDGD